MDWKYNTKCINCVQFSPPAALALGTGSSASAGCSSFLLLGGAEKIIVQTCIIEDSTFNHFGSSMLAPLLDALQFKDVCTIDHSGVPVDCITCSAASNASDRVVMCTVGRDKSLRVLTYDSVRNETELEFLRGHTGYINHASFHPTEPALLASVGDDRTCRLWDLETGQLRVSYKLTSPGMSVCWNKDNPLEMMVAERHGRIRFYNLSAKQPVMSLDTPSTPPGHGPLLSADWSPSNRLLVGAVANGKWYTWDRSKFSQPLQRGVAHYGARKFSWSHCSDQLFATSGSTGCVNVHHTAHNRLPVTYKSSVATDVSWHTSLPVLAVTDEKNLHLLKVEK